MGGRKVLHFLFSEESYIVHKRSMLRQHWPFSMFSCEKFGGTQSATWVLSLLGNLELSTCAVEKATIAILHCNIQSKPNSTMPFLNTGRPAQRGHVHRAFGGTLCPRR